MNSKATVGEGILLETLDVLKRYTDFWYRRLNQRLLSICISKYFGSFANRLFFLPLLCGREVSGLVSFKPSYRDLPFDSEGSIQIY